MAGILNRGRSGLGDKNHQGSARGRADGLTALHDKRLSGGEDSRRPSQPLRGDARTVSIRRGWHGAARDGVRRSDQHRRHTADCHARIGRSGLRHPTVRALHLCTDLYEESGHKLGYHQGHFVDHHTRSD